MAAIKGCNYMRNRFPWLAGIMIIVLILIPIQLSAGTKPVAREVGSIALIEKAYAEGRISRGEKIFHNLQAIFAPQSLPADLKSSSTEMIKCGTPYVKDALDNWSLLSPSQRSMATQYMARPTSDSVYISPDLLFAVHYDIDGPEAVPLEDLNSNNIPDYVERIGLYADSSYRHYRYNLGYLPPPSDGDPYYDIYLLIIWAYGVTVFDQPGDSAWSDYSSFMYVHCNFAGFPANDDPEGSVIGAQKVTCAHEFYHATQLAYNGFCDLWWHEASAVFFEEVVFPEVNDNYSYLPYFFNYPDTFLYSTGNHMYASFIWPQFIAKKFGINTIKNIWERCRFDSALQSMDGALGEYGQSVKMIFPEFTVWNYFTGARGDAAYYDSGSAYPLVPFDNIISSCPFSDVSSNYPPDGLSASYLVTYPDTAVAGLLKLNFTGYSGVLWKFSYITYDNGNIDVQTGLPVAYSGKTDLGIYDFTRYDSIVFIPAVISKWLDDNGYTFNTVINPFGDVDGTGTVDLLDILYLISDIFKSGPPPKYDVRMGDINCDNSVNLIDILLLIGYKYKNGPPIQPCRN
jgi:hypothetical protein